jgi:hypothetical protein
MRTLFWVADVCLFVVFSHGRKNIREFSRLSFIRALMAFIKAHLYDLISIQRPHLLISSY